MKRLFFVFIGLYSCIIIGMQQQEQKELICVTCSDKKICMLPLWQIKESNTLHKILLAAQAAEEHRTNNGFCTITISSVSSQELDAYKNALNQTPSLLKKYFDSLSTAQQHILITAAGKQSTAGEKKLNAKSLSAQLLSCFDPYVVNNNITPEIDLTPLIIAMSKRIINNNIENKNIESHTRIEDNRSITFDDGGICRYIPLSQSNNPYYDSITLPHLEVDQDTHYIIERFQQRSDSLSYFLTPNTPLSSAQDPDPCKKYLWSKSKTCSCVMTLEHPYPIGVCRFSPNGAFLAITSQHPDNIESRLSVTSLGTTTNKADFFDIFCKNDIGNYITPYFNSTSTLIAAATSQGVYIFDMQGNLIKHLVDEKYYQAFDLTWNDDNTTLCVLARTKKEYSLSSKLIIYNMQNYSIKNIVPIVYGYTYDLFRFHNIIIIPIHTMLKATLNPDTTLLPGPIDSLKDTFHWTLYNESCNGLLLVDATTGNIISFCKNPAEDLANVYCIINPFHTFMLTAEVSNPDPTRVKLYDLASGKSKILQESISNICGIGFTPDGRSTIITHGIENTFVHLYDENTAKAIKWLQEKPSLMQRYAIYRLYKARQNGEIHLSMDPQSAISFAISSLPQHVRECIDKAFKKQKRKNVCTIIYC